MSTSDVRTYVRKFVGAVSTPKAVALINVAIAVVGLVNAINEYSKSKRRIGFNIDG